MAQARIERVLQRDRLIVLGAIAAISLLAWTEIVWLAGHMQGAEGSRGEMAMPGMDMTGMDMKGMAMPADAVQPARGLATLAVTFAMWTVMMTGMMLPSAAPMVLLYAAVGRQAAANGRPFAATGWFAGGYIMAWTGFSLIATAAQWVLMRALLLTPAMAIAGSALGGAMLIAAGLYQWTPLKQRCLSHCQTPLSFIQRHGGFRRDAGGALRLGLQHGIYCIGCCWSLMALLFVTGIMNLAWIAALAVFILLEKVVPAGWPVARVAGVLLIAAGGWMMLHAVPFVS
jgi:predicted metal-binding membrane protein